MCRWVVIVLLSLACLSPLAAAEAKPALQPLQRTVDLAVGESQEVELSDGKKAVLALFYLRGLSHETIAEFLEIPIGTVKRRLFEARQAVAESAGPAEEMDLRERRRFVEAVKHLLAKQSKLGE